MEEEATTVATMGRQLQGDIERIHSERHDGAVTIYPLSGEPLDVACALTETVATLCDRVAASMDVSGVALFHEEGTALELAAVAA